MRTGIGLGMNLSIRVEPCEAGKDVRVFRLCGFFDGEKSKRKGLKCVRSDNKITRGNDLIISAVDL